MWLGLVLILCFTNLTSGLVKLAPSRAYLGVLRRRTDSYNTVQLAKRKAEDSEDVSDKKEALSGVLHSIERCYGKGSIQKLGETPAMNVATTSSGSLTLDIARVEVVILEVGLWKYMDQNRVARLP